MRISGGTPIFIPVLPPFSYYNSRYGMAVLPLFALAGAGLVSVAPRPLRATLALLAILAAVVPWMAHPSPANWVTWEESRVNSVARREWTRQTADYLRPRYVRGSGILTGFGDLTGVYRTLGIPLRETFTPDNGLPFDAAVSRPELFLHEPWVVTMGGAAAQTAVNRAARLGIVYSLEKTIIVKDAPVIEIYRRSGGLFTRDARAQRSAGKRAEGSRNKERTMVPHEFVTTAFELPGYRVKRNLGVVRGIVVRSRSIVGTIGAGLQTIVGGNISLFSKLCEQTRNDAFDLMLQHAEALGANAVIGARYDATEIMNGVTEVLSYGTAVEVEPHPK